jgi:hypothetical protein
LDVVAIHIGHCGTDVQQRLIPMAGKAVQEVAMRESESVCPLYGTAGFRRDADLAVADRSSSDMKGHRVNVGELRDDRVNFR